MCIAIEKVSLRLGLVREQYSLDALVVDAIHFSISTKLFIFNGFHIDIFF